MDGERGATLPPGGAGAIIGGEEFDIPPDRAFVFGRADADGVVGLDANDMGISAVAGSVRYESNVWWVVNLSHKRPLLLDEGPGNTPQRLDCGQRHAINVAPLSVLVPGAIFTHRIQVVLPDGQLACVQPVRESSGTLTSDDMQLTVDDRRALTATYCNYLRPFPFRDWTPLTYQEAADLLGTPKAQGKKWSKSKVRKQIERIRERLARAGVYFDGPQAKSHLGEYLVDNGIIGPEDLKLLPPRQP